MQDEMLCTECKEIIINIWKVGWAHKNIYTTCSLKDGLTLVEIDKDLFQYEIIDENSRRFFINKFKELFEQKSSSMQPKTLLNAEFAEKPQKTTLNSENPPLNVIEEVEKSVQNPQFNTQPKAIKKRNIGFEIYD